MIVSGDGGAFEISGMLREGLAFDPTATNAADAVSECEASMRGEGFALRLVLMTPQEWRDARSERAGDGQYVGGGWASPVQPSMWSMPVVTSAAIPAGTILVIDPDHVKILDRQQVVVESFPRDGDNVKKNLVTLGAEVRIGLMVTDRRAVRIVEVAASEVTSKIRRGDGPKATAPVLLLYFLGRSRA